MSRKSRTHYDVLGVEHDATPEQIKAAWKVLIQVWHPDRFNGGMREEAERTSSAINEAFNTLRDPAKREIYDARLAAATRDATGPAPLRQPRRTNSSAQAAARPAPVQVQQQPQLGVLDQLSEFGAVIKRYPRLCATVAAVWMIVFGGSFLVNLVSQPQFGASTTGVASDAVAATGGGASTTADGEGAPSLELPIDTEPALPIPQEPIDPMLDMQAERELMAPEMPPPPRKLVIVRPKR